MAINLLPQAHQENMKRERARRFIVVCGAAVFLFFAVNMILISPLWILFAFQEKELNRELDSVKKSPAFASVSDIEESIRNLNQAINLFNAGERGRFEITPALESVMASRPAGVNIESIYFFKGGDNPPKPDLISVFGRAGSRGALLEFADANTTNPFFSKVHSPITNLLKEFDFDYSLSLELAK